jgi:hypothetical protein
MGLALVLGFICLVFSNKSHFTQTAYVLVIATAAVWQVADMKIIFQLANEDCLSIYVEEIQRYITYDLNVEMNYI